MDNDSGLSPNMRQLVDEALPIGRAVNYLVREHGYDPTGALVVIGLTLLARIADKAPD